MKVMVIGVRGQVARSLAEAGNTPGINLVVKGRPEFEITDPERMERAIDNTQPDCIINAAAYTAVDKAEDERELAFSVNRDGPAMLAKQCARHDIPLIHISTDYVFDGTKSTAYLETDSTNPLGVYGQSKLAGDMVIMASAPKHIILRTSWVYSPFGSNFVKTMLRLAQTRDELNVVSDQFGCPSYAPHIAAGLMQILKRIHQGDLPCEYWGVYNMAGGGETAWDGFAREIFSVSKRSGGPGAQVHAISTDQYPTPARRPANSRLECSKLRQVFGVALPDWRQGVSECVTRLLP